MTIGVFFGSRSPEHDISIITAQLIIAGLKKLGHEVIPVYWDKQGVWHLGRDLDKLESFTKGNFDMSKYRNIELDLENSQKKLVFKQKGLFGKKFVIDLAFPSFHGVNGEDGAAQGIFEILNVPYVGCDVASSALAMDKILTKQIYEQAGIPTAKFLYFSKTDWQSNGKEYLDKIKKELKAPWFVKPSRLGSSIAVAKAENETDLEQAIEVALHYDERCLVEEAVENLKDITCAVIGNENPKPSLLQESVFSDKLFSYEDKYLKGGGAQFGKAGGAVRIPAGLDEKTTGKIQEMAVIIYKLFGCSGIARVDFLYDKKSKKVFANEINTMPGTLYHHLWAKSGVSLPELLQKLLKFAEQRHGRKQELVSVFKSDILKHARSGKLGAKKFGDNPSGNPGGGV